MREDLPMVNRQGPRDELWLKTARFLEVMYLSPQNGVDGAALVEQIPIANADTLWQLTYSLARPFTV
ncbi:MAG: hypothetical protein F6K00_04205 [Leptolyngbya sp. SIOISBB]|nr:hypothetical protein [Leptolyngbya sp. SIOISBB]